MTNTFTPQPVRERTFSLGISQFRGIYSNQLK